MIPDDVLRAVDYAVLGVSGVRALQCTAARLAAPSLRARCCATCLAWNVAEAKTCASCLLRRCSLGCALWACACRSTPIQRQNLRHSEPLLVSGRGEARHWALSPCSREACDRLFAAPALRLWGTRDLLSQPQEAGELSVVQSCTILTAHQAPSCRKLCMQAAPRFCAVLAYLCARKGAAGIAVVQRAAAACRSPLS